MPPSKALFFRDIFFSKQTHHKATIEMSDKWEEVCNAFPSSNLMSTSSTLAKAYIRARTGLHPTSGPYNDYFKCSTKRTIFYSFTGKFILKV